MIIEPFRQEDIPGFLELAHGEGWIAEGWEFVFLLRVFPAGCFTARGREGTVQGYVTSIRHGRSGWIGNLIVRKELRGRGVGTALFREARGALQAAGVATCWLTASSSGRALYEKNGFTSVDTVIRWCGIGRQRHGRHGADAYDPACVLSAGGIDQLAWGDRRDSLMEAVAARGTMLRGDSAFLVLQPGGNGIQFGPFAALESGPAGRLFDAALAGVPQDRKVFLDAPLANRAASRMFRRAGLRPVGSTELMYAGMRPDYRAERLFGLATMGSCG